MKIETTIGFCKYKLILDNGINIYFDFYEKILGDIALRTEEGHVATLLCPETVIEFEEKSKELESPLFAREFMSSYN